MPTKKLAMWLFIIADTMTFAAVWWPMDFCAMATPNWPTAVSQHHQRRDHDFHPADQQSDHADRSASRAKRAIRQVPFAGP